MSAATHYERLGVDETASIEEIKRAYRRMARRLHPDANRGNPSANRQFGEVTDAYRTLSDPELRAGYDASLNKPGGGAPRDDPSESAPHDGDDLDDRAGADDPRRTAPGDAGTTTSDPFGAETVDSEMFNDAGGQGWGESDAFWDGSPSSDPYDREPSDDRTRHEPRTDDWHTRAHTADDQFDRRNDDGTRRAQSDQDAPAPGFGWGEPEAQTSVGREDVSAGAAPIDAPSARATDRTAMGWHDARVDDWGESTPWEGNPSLDAAGGTFGVRPDDIRLGRADRVTQAVCVAPVVWIAGLAMDGSVPHLWRRLAAYRDASSAGDATDWERTQASGDLLATTGRFGLVGVVVVLAWLVAGRTLRRQSAAIPRRRGWWRSPGWYGVARLIRVASFVGCASLATAVLLLPTFADHARTHEAAAEMADAPADQAAQLEDAYRSAKSSAASGNWRVVLWLGIMPGAWIASGRLPARFGYYSQLDAF